MADETRATDGAYRVLARKYRPSTFAELIGQEAMVQTLANAIESGRLAHAFLLTGVRGVGKTTTARLLARALNCTGPDGQGGPTVDPCGQCDSCRSIAESRHVDVLEMDAASHTGVDDIRDIIDGVNYAAVSARYKIYIIDEVHMLSRNAFNALLKTLEEPPAHVKFLFATTEVRKLPVTVLSRCQRFDLRRVPSDRLVTHFAGIVDKEGASAEEAALAMIARAAEGSVRDGLSLLDQAIAHGAGTVTADQVRDMLGLADRAQVLDLFEHVMAGRAADALTSLRGQYDRGADPAIIIQDLLDIAHWLTRLKVVPDAGTDALHSEAEKTLGVTMAQALAMPHLTRGWQMLLKGLHEVRTAPSPIAAAEMVIIRLCYVADLPAPADVVKSLKAERGKSGGQQAAPPPGGGGATAVGAQGTGTSAPAGAGTPTARHSATVIALATNADQNRDGDIPAHPLPVTFEALVTLFDEEREGILATHLRDNVGLVSFAPGRLELKPQGRLPNDLLGRVKHCLETWTGSPWIVTISNGSAATSLRQQDEDRAAIEIGEATELPLVAAILEAFPGAEIARVIDREAQRAREMAQDRERAGNDGMDKTDADDDYDPLENDF